MKRALASLFCCTLALPAFAAGTAPRLAPLPLNAAQMDSVTGGAMTLSATATVEVNGATYVATYADASVKNTGGGVVQIGRAEADVTACCNGDTVASVSFEGAADGTMVMEHTRIRNPNYQNGQYAASGSYMIISITPPGR